MFTFNVNLLSNLLFGVYYVYEYIISLDQNLTLDRKKLPTLRENYPVPNPIRVLDPALSPELSKM